MSIKGSPLTHFRRAIELGDLSPIRRAAADLPRFPLEDALLICVLMAEQDSPAFERAAVRWLARFALEARNVELAALDEGVGAFEVAAHPVACGGACVDRAAGRSRAESEDHLVRRAVAGVVPLLGSIASCPSPTASSTASIHGVGRTRLPTMFPVSESWPGGTPEANMPTSGRP